MVPQVDHRPQEPRLLGHLRDHLQDHLQDHRGHLAPMQIVRGSQPRGLVRGLGSDPEVLVMNSTT